ncbi:COX15/CtaA family protein [Rhizobium paknamense]|uniref:Heme A synthase n=1 Tax=Rhizobium paknamense TaxID=1206817 RepID=A0ABU0I755_9HYPH|nr:COX15/CtaA family protein [Rhizobium paknamense]MDQ0454051.1 cytochrome c oxidase assembly protein subunit 15 [Rhizobium paknamense]
MTMTSTASQATLVADMDRQSRNRRAVRLWLWVVIVAVFSLVLVGGATRLTNSGLSITQWKPIHGVIPPLNAAEWEEEFALYKQIPQYELVNKGMTVEEFKTIFWWEWAHRFLARSIGVIFALPLLFFWLTGRIERQLRWPLVGILALGGLQGFIGWWMVSSGLTERTEVSQYRLATHLIMACLIFSSSVWVMRGVSHHSSDHAGQPTARRWAWVLLGLAFLQIYLGALVAGLDAGLSYNTWPLMDGALVPGDLLVQTPAWINFFENPKTVQFIHRLGAYTLLLVALAHMVYSLKTAPGTTHARRSVVLFVLICLQASIGIATLLLHVPLDMALTHQGGALIVLGFAVAHLRGFYGEYPAETQVRVTT